MDTARTHPAPTYALKVAGQDIATKIAPRLVSLTLTEGRENTADQLDIELSDHDGRLELPRKEAEIELHIGWVGQPLIDKGLFVVDEVEHTGAPDKVTIRARAADLGGQIRTRAEKSWRTTTLGAIIADLARRSQLTHKVDERLAQIAIDHLTQTNESDMHLLTRLARKHDAVATVKKKHLLFMPINGTRNSKGQSLPAIHITRQDGDQHRWSSSTRDAFDGVKAYWSDSVNGKRHGVVAGKKTGNVKTLKETYASEQDALAAARAERQRLERGLATFELTLAVGRPEVTPQSPVTVSGWKEEINGQGWLVKEVVHSLNEGSGWTSKVQMERGVASPQLDAP
ncbi:phage late control D family protein [Comamonas aquatica]|uniref:phage late control D family protein n=1 Tax=Comamonas aquatica TaxID=225991 RepID=UPI00244C3192|nr:phage late control D family protein [Comamonas aquatica]MDH0200819.1 phage late control D family protein [Comamonas aquatica]